MVRPLDYYGGARAIRDSPSDVGACHRVVRRYTRPSGGVLFSDRGTHQDAASLMTRTLLAPCLLLGMLVASSNVHSYALETRHAAAAARGTRDAQRDDVADRMTHRRFVVSQRGRRRGLRSADSGCEERRLVIARAAK